MTIGANGRLNVAVIGAGWAGCAAAVEATRLGHRVTVFEASRTPGGRARRVDVAHGGQNLALDNGQHILIGAYSETLKLMAELGIDVPASFLRMPLTMQFPDGNGLVLPQLPAPFDALVGILRARGWSIADKWSLLKAATLWQLRQFKCPAAQTVADLCSSISPQVMATLIEPLCVSALNTPADRASGQVFLRVLQDSMFAVSGGSNLLLPRADLSALLPDAALGWLRNQGGQVQLGCRVSSITPVADSWNLAGASDAQLGQFDAIILACPPLEAARLAGSTALPCADWLALAEGLRYEAIATVYAHAPGARLAFMAPRDKLDHESYFRLTQPMLALVSNNLQPAQLVFDRGQLGGPPGLLAFVVSASKGDAATLASQVAAQATQQLNIKGLQVLQTVVEKRATFACTPGLQRPGEVIAPGLLACGDYVDGPYPATLEGAVRSGFSAARLLPN